MKEVIMGKINWKHVFLIGLILGAIESALQLFSAMLFAGDELWELRAMLDAPGAIGDWHMILTLLVYVLVGIATVWLYAAIRPRYGPGPRTAAIAGFVIWLVTYAAHVQWGTAISLFSTGALVVTTLVAVPIFVGTTVFCVSAYKEAEEPTGPVASEGVATEPAEG